MTVDNTPGETQKKGVDIENQFFPARKAKGGKDPLNRVKKNSERTFFSGNPQLLKRQRTHRYEAKN